MLARIQTLYLILALVIIVLNIFVFPLWLFEYQPSQIETVRQFELFALNPPESLNTNMAWFWGFNVLIVTTLILTFGSIFLFSQRNLQLLFVKSGIISSFLTIALGVVSALTYSTPLKESFPSSEPGIGFYLLFLLPLLLFLAMQGVKKDEKIATAYKRL